MGSLGSLELTVTNWTTTLLRVLQADCLRALRGHLRDDRWIVTVALACRPCALLLAGERLECIELFGYWQWDVFLWDQECALGVGWDTWNEWDDELATDYRAVLDEIGYFDSD